MRLRSKGSDAYTGLVSSLFGARHIGGIRTEGLPQPLESRPQAARYRPTRIDELALGV